MPRAFTLILLVAVALGAMTVQARPVASTPTGVTLIGDSIATAIEFVPDARVILAKEIDLDLEVAPCRRIAGDSCPYAGKRPPTLVELLPPLRLGSTVVVATGYNDYEDTFASTIEEARTALRSAGVENVLWLTLRAERQSYQHLNELILDAAKRHSEITIVDWNLYAQSHPDWFQEDGLHLGRDGAIGLATLVHQRLDDLGLVASPTPRAPRPCDRDDEAARRSHRASLYGASADEGRIGADPLEAGNGDDANGIGAEAERSARGHSARRREAVAPVESYRCTRRIRGPTLHDHRHTVI